jgi:glucose-6-phosphate 1-dehydrogenase
MTTPPHSDALVFFGATGDLAYKQIFPALQALVKKRALNVPVVGVAKSGWTVEQLRARAKDSLEHHGGLDRRAFDELSARLHYVDGDYADAATFASLRRELAGAQRPLHYLAIPPSTFGAVVSGLGKSGCATQARVAVEKPFGRDLASARALNATLHEVFPESSIFRIDHYLGKEAVLNLLYFRFCNRLQEVTLNRDHVDNVQITMAESFGVQGRGRFYEETGALRDVIQNHMLQIVAILAMDPPVGNDVEAVRDEKARLLKAIRSLEPADVVRGQFRGYRDEPGVARDSLVETFAAVKLRINTWRWADVPFFIRAGKSLPVNAVEIRVQLKRPPIDVYPDSSRFGPGYFRFRLGPDVTSLAVGMHVKRAGEAMEGRNVELVASEGQAHDMLAYERLLGDAMRGDVHLFGREDAIEEQWRIVDPILDMQTPPLAYEPGTWGPAEAHTLVSSGPDAWHEPTDPKHAAPSNHARRAR